MHIHYTPSDLRIWECDGEEYLVAVIADYQGSGRTRSLVWLFGRISYGIKATDIIPGIHHVDRGTIFHIPDDPWREEILRLTGERDSETTEEK